MGRPQIYHPWVHRWAVVTVLVSFLPVTMGALTTTRDAGMAFSDWPTSDGQNMLTYPWLQSAGDKFIEHGHRLAGMLIGLVSLILVWVTFRFERRMLPRALAAVVLVGVIVQGVLGGTRVRLDERVLAMIHGQFAAWVVALMAVLACVTSRAWGQMHVEPARGRASTAFPFVVLLPIAVVVQYTLGGLLRHMHTAMFEHLIFAGIVLLLAVVAALALWRTQVWWLRRSAMQVIGIVCLQLVLGAGAWVTRFGLPQTGFVATAGSQGQVWFRTAHTVGGMLLFASAVVAVVRLSRVSQGGQAIDERPPQPVASLRGVAR